MMTPITFANLSGSFFGAELKDFLYDYPFTAAWWAHAEGLPHENNRITLDSELKDARGLPAGRLHYEWGDNDVCVAAASDPNRSLYCNQADSGIPWQKQIKATVVYPIAWHQISVSMAYQGLNGYLSGTAAQAYGGFTAGTGFDRPNGLGTFYLVAPTTRYAADCKGACTPGALVLPAMAASGVASISVPLVAPETEFTPRINQFDFSVSKSFEFGVVRVTPKLDLFNALNSDDYTAVASAQYGAATYMRPSTVLQGRIIRFGADVRW